MFDRPNQRPDARTLADLAALRQRTDGPAAADIGSLPVAPRLAHWHDGRHVLLAREARGPRRQEHPWLLVAVVTVDFVAISLPTVVLLSLDAFHAWRRPHS
jgi:hypothetical protein